MVVQTILESFSRCFGAPGPTIVRPADYETGDNNSISQHDEYRKKQVMHLHEENVTADSRRRQGRALDLELQNEEWDNLFSHYPEKFEDQHYHPNQYHPPIENICSTANTTSVSSISRNNTGKHSTGSRKALDVDIAYAEAFEKVQNSASTSRKRSSSQSKRESKLEIFREKKSPQNVSLATRILGKDGVKALCFATPVTESPIANDELSSVGGTLDTADDTTISNFLTDAQLAALQANPPMPLFNHFKVDCAENSDDAIMSIVASGSHHSARTKYLHAEEMQSVNDRYLALAKLPSERRVHRESRRIPLDPHRSPSNPRIRSPESFTPIKREEYRQLSHLNRHSKGTSDDIPPPIQKISGSHSNSLSSHFG